MADFAFLHGGGQGSWVWAETLAALALQSGGAARTLALDVPGCGAKRRCDTAAISCDDIAAELVADIEAARLTDVVLVGHSQAGGILPRMAAIRPGLFRRLVFVTCSMPPTGTTVLEMMGEGLHGESETQIGWSLDPAVHSLAERYRAMFCNDMSDTAADAFVARLGKDMWPPRSYAERDWPVGHLAAMPVSYVVCLRDDVLPPAWQERFAERFLADRLVRIDAGHQVMNTRPHALAEALLAEADG